MQKHPAALRLGLPRRLLSRARSLGRALHGTNEHNTAESGEAMSEKGTNFRTEQRKFFKERRVEERGNLSESFGVFRNLYAESTNCVLA